MTNTCNFFRFVSCDTWKRIKLARRGGFKIYETTVTQNILYYFYLFRLRNSSNIQLFESTDEKTNGNDLEILINTSSGYIKLPTQAKIIYSNGKYSALKHKNQIHDLISYAALPTVKGIPLYIFYNYYDSGFNFPSSLCNLAVKKEDYGCTFCNAFTLKNNFATLGVDADGYQNWVIPTFTDLHPQYCDPFWRIVCCHSSTDDINNLKGILKVGDLKLDISTYTLDQLNKERFWRPLNMDDNDNKSKNLDRSNESGEIGFNPRFRIRVD